MVLSSLRFTDEWVNNIPNFGGVKIGEVEETLREMEILVMIISISNSSAIPNLSLRVLKDAFMVMLPRLVYMYTLSFSTGTFPDAWKIANVVPLKKGGDPTDVSNLRPISLLPSPGKRAEQIMHTHNITYIQDRVILNQNQGGFRKNNSTISTTAKFIDDI